MRGYLKTLNWLFKLQPKLTKVGKHPDSDLCLQNGGVDEHHATIEWNMMEFCYVLKDLNSAHGTYVNDCHIHNATVRLTPGDEIHFGYGGSTYKLFLDPSNPLPVLAVQSAASPTGVRNRTRSFSVAPHPPHRPRPASAGAKRSSMCTNVPEYSGSSHKPGSGKGRGLIIKNADMIQCCQSMQNFSEDKEECWARCREEQNAVLMSQSEAQSKECMISALREEVSALRLQLSQSKKNDPDVRYKLHNLTRDIQEKKEEIQRLKEQMLELQVRAAEFSGQALAERDQRISNLIKQLDRMKSENSKSTALISSMQTDMSAWEKQALNLTNEIDNLRKDMRHKDAQLSNMANKLTKLNELEKHQEEFLARKEEVESLKMTVEKMEMTLREKQKDITEQNTERDFLKHSLELKIQEQSSLQAEMSKLKQKTLQRELKAHSELRHTQTMLENICSQIMKHVLITSETVSEQEILERLPKLREQKEVSTSRVHELEQQLQEHEENQRVVEEDTEKLKDRLAEFQGNVQKLYVVDPIQRIISALQDVNVCPAVSWVQTHTVSILSSLHTLLQDTGDMLLATGVEVSEETGGVAGAVKSLCQQHKEIQSQLRRLQAEREQVEDKKDQANDMQLKQKSMEQVHQELQAVLHSEIEAREVKWRARMEEAEKRELELREKLRDVEVQEEQWKKKIKECDVQEDEWKRRAEEALQRGEEQERERTRLEIEEYKEQVRQHAHTIVAMEEQMNAILQKEEEIQEERDSLARRLTEALNKMDVKPSVSLEQPEEQEKLRQTVTSLRASLEVSQQEAVRQSEIIASLSRDLAHAHARLSDLTGELSEEQKLGLETHKALVVDQRMQLSILTQKLTVNAELLEQNEKKLTTLRKKLIQTEADLRRERGENPDLVPTVPHTKDVAIMVCPSQLPNKASKTIDKKKCKDCRQENILCQGKQTLSAMKERISALEQKWSPKVFSQQREPIGQDQKKLVQMKIQSLKRSAAPTGSFNSVTGFAFPEVLNEAALERTARLDLSDALEISERTYVDLIRALCDALGLREDQLSGCVPLKHLPPGERTHMATLRQEDLELLCSQIALQNSRSQNKDLLLQENQREIQMLRDSQAVGQQLQIELNNVRSELTTVKRESSTLRLTLAAMQTQLQHKPHYRKSMALNMDKMEGRSRRIGHHNCVPDNDFGKGEFIKRLKKQDRREMAKEEKAVLMNKHKERESCKISTPVDIVSSITALP